MPAKLNSMRLLEQNKIPYELVEYPDDLRDAEANRRGVGCAAVSGLQDAGCAAGKRGQTIPVMLAASRHLNLKALAAVAGEKKIKMATHNDAEALTGLKVGGISALALVQKHWTVFLDQPATEHQHILISAGQRGMDLRVPTMALVGLVHARIADVGIDADE